MAAREDFTRLTGPYRRELVAAFRDADIDTLIRLLTSGPDVMRLVPAPANGQPGFACYLRHGDGGYRAHAVQVLEPRAAGLGRITIFLDPGLFVAFGWPPVLTPDRAADLDLVPA